MKFKQKIMSEITQNPESQDKSGECVNKGRPVYFSYARSSNKKPGWEHISDCVESILKEFDSQNIEYRLDTRDIAAGDRISDFEKEIGWNSEVVVLVFSDKYFRSMHCMYEFVQIKKALKKYPNKRLLCIKSGDFHLADTNYIYELENYWGNVKQEYEVIERHHSREHSGIEKAAFENGFYFDDILGLYPFFSALNYSYANTEDWSSFAADIKKYYIETPKSLFADERKRKQLLKNLKFFGLGIVTLTVIVGLLLWKFKSNVNKISKHDDIEVLFPEYSSNAYLDDGLAYIKAVRVDSEHTVIDFHAVNTTDDTLKAIPAGHSKSVHIVADGKNYDLVKAYFIPENVNNLASDEMQDVPEHFPGGKGSSIDFCLEFAAIPTETETIDFVEKSDLGVFGLKLQRTILKDGLMNPVADSSKNFVVRDVEFNEDETVLYCSFSNATGSDFNLSASNTDCYIMVDGKRHNIKNASGIPMSPKTISVANGAKTEFALFFPPIDRRDVAIDLIFNSQISIKAIKL